MNVQLFNHRNYLISGSRTFNMWMDDQSRPLGTTALNFSNDIVLSLEFELFPQIVELSLTGDYFKSVFGNVFTDLFFIELHRQIRK